MNIHSRLHMRARLPRYLVAALLALLLGAGWPYAAAQAAAPQPVVTPGYRYVEATGHTLRDAALAFYDAHGGQTAFGNPLTEVITEDGQQVQYFQNARFEIGAKSVSVSALGRAATAGRTEEEAFQWRAGSDDPARRFVKESGHTLGGAFGWMWDRSGSLAAFGYPISEETTENGQLVQYFERAKMILVSEADVALAPLGQQESARRGVSAAALARVPPREVVGQWSMTIAGATAQHNVALAAQKLNGATIAPGATFSFLSRVGAVTAQAGYKAGAAIVSGTLVNDTIGGGICYVSTALYRAAFAAGMPIVERHGHSFRLNSFNDEPGLDAAVYTPNVDLRFRNDTGAALDVVATYKAGVLSVTLWGEDGGRTTTVSKPAIKVLASNVPDDGTVQIVQPAQIISVNRTVKASSGAIVRSDLVATRYQALVKVIDTGSSNPALAPINGPR